VTLHSELLGFIAVSSHIHSSHLLSLFMWPFSAPRNPYGETIEAKRTCRADALKLAPPFSTEEHQKYLSVTGTAQLALPLNLTTMR
jgi:hypothetical protein